MSRTIFKKLTYRNFLSTGNKNTVIDFTANNKTVLVGKNGTGKCVEDSTIINIHIEDVKIHKLFEEHINELRNVDRKCKK